MGKWCTCDEQKHWHPMNIFWIFMIDVACAFASILNQRRRKKTSVFRHSTSTSGDIYRYTKMKDYWKMTSVHQNPPSLIGNSLLLFTITAEISWWLPLFNVNLLPHILFKSFGWVQKLEGLPILLKPYKLAEYSKMKILCAVIVFNVCLCTSVGRRDRGTHKQTVGKPMEHAF